MRSHSSHGLLSKKKTALWNSASANLPYTAVPKREPAISNQVQTSGLRVVHVLAQEGRHSSSSSSTHNDHLTGIIMEKTGA